MLVVFSLNFVADTKFSVIISELLCGGTGKYLLNNKKVTAEKTKTAEKMKFSIKDFFSKVTKSAGNLRSLMKIAGLKVEGYSGPCQTS